MGGDEPATTVREPLKAKWFWWAMGVVGAVMAAGIGAAAGLDGNKPVIVNLAPSVDPTSPPVDTTRRASDTTTTTSRPTTTVVVRTGVYNGQAQNAGLVGGVAFTIDSMAVDGSSVGRIRWSGSLNGDGTVRGTISGDSGTFNGVVQSVTGPWNLALTCRFVGAKGINCDYVLASSLRDGRAPQGGAFTASRT